MAKAAHKLSAKSALSRRKFEESKHRRGAGGRFADKPGAGDDAPKKTRAPAKGKSSGVKDTDIIRIHVTGNPKKAQAAIRFSHYKEGMSIGDYITAVGDKKQALRDLAWDRKQGWISFADAAESAAPAAAAAVAAVEVTAVEAGLAAAAAAQATKTAAQMSVGEVADVLKARGIEDYMIQHAYIKSDFPRYAEMMSLPLDKRAEVFDQWRREVVDNGLPPPKPMAKTMTDEINEQKANNKAANKLLKATLPPKEPKKPKQDKVEVAKVSAQFMPKVEAVSTQARSSPVGVPDIDRSTYRTFEDTDNDKYIAWEKKMFKLDKYREIDMVVEQRDAIDFYTRDGAARINEHLRLKAKDPEKVNAKLEKEIARIDASYSVFQGLDRDLIAFRGINSIETPHVADIIKNLEPGDKWMQPGYTSLSTDKKVSVGFAGGDPYSDPDDPQESEDPGIMMRILLPRGHKGAMPVVHTSNSPDEREILVKRNGSLTFLGRNEEGEYEFTLDH